MDGSLIIAALIAAPLCYLFLRWYLPRLPKRKTWREQFNEGRDAARARSEQIAAQSRQYQEIQKAKREGRQSDQDNA